MAEPPSPASVIETLRSMGFLESDIEFRQLDNGWRIRAQGGLVIHMRKGGHLVMSGRNARNVSKALGLSSRQKPAT
ncbi:MAG: hypothetical protein ACR652_07725 [Methylocystis sp.]|uniref:hypothetical protein n=1 Tax=Methylocystis sp. TaxID=1911079 RepID=UPI003DA1FC42